MPTQARSPGQDERLDITNALRLFGGYLHSARFAALH